MVWHSHLFQNVPPFVVIHRVKTFGIVNKAKIDVFLELSCFFYDPADVGNWISGSSVCSKTSLNIWKFMVHVLLKPGLENYFTNLRYADDTTLMAESDEELKHLLMKVKEESEKAGFKTQHSRNQNHGIWSHHFMANR